MLKWNTEVRHLGTFQFSNWIILLIAILNVPSFLGNLIMYVANVDMFSPIPISRLFRIILLFILRIICMEI